MVYHFKHDFLLQKHDDFWLNFHPSHLRGWSGTWSIFWLSIPQVA